VNLYLYMSRCLYILHMSSGSKVIRNSIVLDGLITDAMGDILNEWRNPSSTGQFIPGCSHDTYTYFWESFLKVTFLVTVDLPG